MSDAALRDEIRTVQNELNELFEKRRELGFGAHGRRNDAPPAITERITELTRVLRALKHREDSLRAAPSKK